MKRLTSVLLIVLIAAHYVSAVSLRRRRAADETGEDTGVVDSIINLLSMTQGLPIVGGYIISGRNWIGDTGSAIADFDNGIIARILGGALPCEIDLDVGFSCTGVTDESNVASLIMALLDQSPLPNIVKSGISGILLHTLQPMMDVIFGGVMLESA